LPIAREQGKSRKVDGKKRVAALTQGQRKALAKKATKKSAEVGAAKKGAKASAREEEGARKGGGKSVKAKS
jgi:hypothetical protein